MADLKKTIDIVFGAVDNTGQVVKGIGNRIDSLNGSVGSLASPLASVTDSVIALDAAIVGLGIAMAAVSIKEAAEFQTQFNEISTLLDENTGALSLFSTDIKDYASSSTQSIDQINAAVYSAISAGVDYKDSLQVISDAERLAVAGKADLGDTLVSLVSTLNSYGAGMDQAGDFSETFFNIVKLGQTTIPELAGSLANVTGIASGSGVSFEELGAAIAALTSSGLSTSTAITGVKAALSNILKPTKDAQAEAERLGLTFDSSALASQGLGGFVEQLRLKTGGSVESMTQLFGSVEALNAVMILTGNGSAKFAESLQLMASGSNNLESAFVRMQGNLDLVSQRLKNNLELAFIAFGTQILPQFTDDVGAISKIFESLTFSISETDSFAPIYDALNNLGVDIEQIALGMARSLPRALQLVDFGDALESWGRVGDALSGLFDGIDLTTPEGLAEVIQGLVDSVSSLGSVTEGISRSLVPFINSIVDAVDAFNDLDDSAKVATGQTLGIGKAFDTISPLIDHMSTAITTLGAGLSLLATKGLIDSAKGLTGLIPSFESAAAGAGKLAKGFGLLSAATAGYELGSIIYENFDDEIRSVTDEVFGFIDGIVDFSGKGAAFEQQVNLLADKFSSLGIEIDKSAINLENVEYFWQSYYSALRQSSVGTADASDSFVELAGSIDQVNSAVAEQEVLTGDLGVAFEGVNEQIDQATGQLVKFKEKTSDVVVVQEQAAQVLARTQEQADRFAISMAEISADVYRAQIDLEIAQATRDLEIFRSSVESLADTVVGSQNLIGDLVGSLAAGADLSSAERFEILNLIRREALLKREQLELQNELIEKELENIQLKNEHLRNGGAEMTITADGLEPELEAFMFRILERIQIRATQENAAFLIGAA